MPNHIQTVEMELVQSCCMLDVFAGDLSEQQFVFRSTSVSIPALLDHAAAEPCLQVASKDSKENFSCLCQGCS